MRRHGHMIGFTLIEVMVALLVLSVGLIGVAALNARALSASGTAVNRSEAVLLAGELADRIRGNRIAGAAYAGAAADLDCDDPTDQGGRDCGPEPLAAHDLFSWQSAVARSLPGGRGQVEVDTSAVPMAYALTVTWEEPTREDAVSFAFEFSLLSY